MYSPPFLLLSILENRSFARFACRAIATAGAFARDKKSRKFCPVLCLAYYIQVHLR